MNRVLESSSMSLRLLAALFLLCASAGCRLKTADPAEVERTIVFWEQQDAMVMPFLDGLFERFKKLPGNADVRFIRTHYQNEDLHQQFQTASIAGNPPDIMLSPSDKAGVYCISGFILPVDGLFDLGRYNKAGIDAITLDGKTWGVPMTNGNHLMLFYNKRMVKSPPETMDDVHAFCEARTKALSLDHCWAIHLGEPFWLMPWLGAYGGWPIDGRTPTLDTQAMRDALALMRDLKDVRKEIPPECDYNCMDVLFKERKVAFIVNGDWAIAVYQKVLGDELGAARIPRLSRGGPWPTPMVSGVYFMLSSKLAGPKLELVRRFVDFATSEEMQIEQVKALGRLPSLAKASKSKAILEDPLLKASMDQVLVGKPMPMATEMRAVWDAMRPLYGRFLTRQLTPGEASAKMQKEALAKIAEMNE